MNAFHVPPGFLKWRTRPTGASFAVTVALLPKLKVVPRAAAAETYDG